MAVINLTVYEGTSPVDLTALREEFRIMSETTKAVVAEIQAEVAALNTNLTAAQALLDEKQTAIAAGIAALIAKIQNTFPIDTELQALLDGLKDANERTVMLTEDIATTETGEGAEVME